MVIFWTNALVYFIHAAGIAPWLRQTRVITPADAVRNRFDALTEQIFSYYSIFGGILWGGVMLLGLATFTSALFGISLNLVIMIVGVTILLYSVTGGSWSVFIADNLQAMVLLAITLVISGLCLVKIGGVGHMLQLIQDTPGLAADYAFVKSADHVYSAPFPIDKGLFTTPWILAMVFNSVLVAANLTGCYRYLSVKTGADARKAAWLAGGLMVLGSFIWIIPPITGRLLFAEEINAITNIKPTDAAYAIVAKHLLPPGLIGLVLIAMFAATMSSLDSALTGTAAIVMRNVLLPLRRYLKRPELSDSKQLLISRIVNLGLGLWAVTWAFYLGQTSSKSGLFNVMLNVIAMIAVPASLPFACALFVKKVPKWAAVFSMGTGLTASASIFLAEKFNPDLSLVWANKMWTVSAAVIIPFLFTRLLSHTSPQEFYDRVDDFFKLIKTPIDFKAEVGEGNDQQQLKIVGYLGLIMGASIALLLFVADDTIHRLAVGFVSLFILSISSLLVWLGVRSGAK
jgi:Na+/proline symporter